MRNRHMYFICISLIAIVIIVVMWGSKTEKGDYILGKEINSNQIPNILVVHNITKREAKAKSAEYFLKHHRGDDVMYYHVKDIDTYNSLRIGEKVTVKTSGYVMLSSPKQAVATEIIRHHR